MCGIAVAIDWDGAEAAVRQLLIGVAHRGDVSDPVLSPRPNTAMGTRRLRIVDADRAMQPQLSFDRGLIVSFNGEIYNHDELRRELAGLGVPFRTESDGEVLANALQVWGVKALQRFNGMFAFVAIDIATGEFLAARDPYGVKPLYLIQSETGFLFCSEIRPLLAAAPSGDVLLLPPGYLLSRKFCAGYKSPIRGPFARNAPCDIDALDAKLKEAVRIRLPDGLPVATLLSGGIDSTLVAHYAHMFRPEAPGYFLGDETAPDYQYVSAYAAKSGIDLRLVSFDSCKSFEQIGEIVAVSESFEPNVIRGAACSYILSRAIHEDGFRVALCGEGADELFCGYPPLEYSFRHGNTVGRSARDECLAMMHRTSLQRVDRCAMKFQLEVREPFLDPSIAVFAMELDGSALVQDINGVPKGKMPLRNLYELYPNELPASIRDREKLPFNEGAGIGNDGPGSQWQTLISDAISDRALDDGKREFEGFDIQTKEELYYLRKLADAMDVSRVPQLRARTRIQFPSYDMDERLKSSII